MMDYKYIEQLLERYFLAETTLEEEHILHLFFSQEQVPEAFRPYQPLFCYGNAADETLSSDFDERIMELIGDEEATAEGGRYLQTNGRQGRMAWLSNSSRAARVATVKERLIPLLRAAAIVAIILTLSNAAQAPFDSGYNTADDGYAVITEEIDSASLLTPVQAENVADTTKVELPTY